MVGRGLKLLCYHIPPQAEAASPGRMVGRGLKQSKPGCADRRGSASPGRMVGRGLKQEREYLIRGDYRHRPAEWSGAD